MVKISLSKHIASYDSRGRGYHLQPPSNRWSPAPSKKDKNMTSNIGGVASAIGGLSGAGQMAATSNQGSATGSAVGNQGSTGTATATTTSGSAIGSSSGSLGGTGTATAIASSAGPSGSSGTVGLVVDSHA